MRMLRARAVSTSVAGFMKTRRVCVVLASILPLGLACGSTPEENPGLSGSGGQQSAQGGATNGGMTGAVTGTGGAQGGQPTAGAGGASGGSGGAAQGGQPTAGAGGASGGTPATGGTAGGGTGGDGLAGSGGAETGGAAGASGGGGDGGTPATGGSGGMAGTGTGGGPSELKGGASAAFICPAGATYGDPLAGMSTVSTISAPTSGPATYFAFLEGPIWIGSVGKLFFSDNASQPQERIWVVTPPSTTPEVFMENSGSNGLAVDSDDRIVAADQRNKQLTRIDPTAATPTAMPIVSAGSAKPNDVIVRSDGNIYFTDPQEARAFFRVSPAGMLSEPITTVSAPNGIALSLDENTLYVGNVQTREITTFPVAGDGSVDGASGTLFATTEGHTLDGFALDCAGNLYAATSNGVEVFSPEGTPLGTVPTDESYNPTFGGADRKTLFVASRAQLKVVTLAIPGLPN